MIYFHYIITIPQKTFQNPQDCWGFFCKEMRNKALLETLLYYKPQNPVVFWQSGYLTRVSNPPPLRGSIANPST